MLELLYNLKERLHFCTLASVSLIGQDFKLKKSIDEFEPVSKSSKVLERIYNSAKTLYEGDSDNKVGDLLDLLALINAVIITQTTTNLDDKIDTTQIQINEELSGINTKIIPMSHKMLQTFYNSVYKTGSGRIDALDTCLTNTDLVFDYSILNGLLHALSDKSVDVRKVAVKKLSNYDESLVPLLRKKSDELFAKKPNNSIYYIMVMSNIMDCDEYILGLMDKTKNVQTKFYLEVLLSETEKNVDRFIEKLKNDTSNYTDILLILKILGASIKENKNYMNLFPIKETLAKKESSTRSAMLLYCNTDPEITNIILNELKNYTPKNFDDIDLRNIVFLHTCVNSATDDWFDIMLTYFKDKTLLANQNKYIKYRDLNPEDSQSILLQIICDYIIYNQGNLNQAFLDECYSLCDDKSKVMFNLIKDMQTMSSEDLFNAYSHHLNDDDNTDVDSKCILYVMSLLSLSENNDFCIYPALYHGNINYSSTQSIKNALKENKIKLYQHLDERWYELLKKSIDLYSEYIYSSRRDSKFKIFLNLGNFNTASVPLNNKVNFNFDYICNDFTFQNLQDLKNNLK